MQMIDFEYVFTIPLELKITSQYRRQKGEAMKLQHYLILIVLPKVLICTIETFLSVN